MNRRIQVPPQSVKPMADDALALASKMRVTASDVKKLFDEMECT